MGVEVVDSKLSNVSAETVADGKTSLKENGVVKGTGEPIKFGSDGADAPVNEEVNKASEVYPKDAVDEWPADRQIHSVYFVKYRSYEDQKLKAKLDLAEKELQKKSQSRSQILGKLRTKKDERAQVINQIIPLSAENKQFRTMVDEKRKEMEPLQQKLGQLRGTMGGGRERGPGLCSSEEELDAVIKSLEYRIQHESITLNEEKQILREIRQLEGTRNEVIANAATRAKIEESVGDKDTLQDQVKLIGVDLDGVRKEQQVVRAKIKQLDEEKIAIEKEIEALQNDLTALTEKRDNAYQNILELRKQREEGNAPFFQNRTLLNKARELAAQKNIDVLKHLSENEVDKFISLWTSKKAIRDDYERRLLTSLDYRQLSRDGRMRNPDEKPLVLPDALASSETEAVMRINAKQPKGDSVLPAQRDGASADKVQKEKNSKEQKEANDKKKDSLMEQNDIDFGEQASKSEILPKDPAKVNKIDGKKLKEMKREEEMEKNRQALERKKKLAEKAAAKAAIKAQKEAEKKRKALEKKAKKKDGVSASAPDSQEPNETETVEETVEPEKTGDKVETPVPTKKKERKDNVVRHRPRARGTDSLPKAFLKRKKATNYWLWTAPAAVAILLLLAVGYIYLM